jgi:hypothetical protein
MLAAGGFLATHLGRSRARHDDNSAFANAADSESSHKKARGRGAAEFGTINRHCW